MLFTMSPLRWIGLGLALAGASLVAFLWFSYIGSEKKLAAATERLSADTAAFKEISRVDTNTALVLKARQARQDSQTVVYVEQKKGLADAIAKSPAWAAESVPADVAASLQ